MSIPGFPTGGTGATGWDFAGTLANIGANIAQGLITAKTQKKLLKAQMGIGQFTPMGAGFGAGGIMGTVGSMLGLPGYDQPTQMPAMPGTGVVSSAINYLQGQTVCPDMFRRPAAGPRSRAISLLSAINPDTGRLHFWRHVGHPILYSGDVSHCKTVNRILGRARRGGRARRKS